MIFDLDGIPIYTFFEPQPIKPYHIKESILPMKELEKRKKEMDKRTNMKPPYSLDSLDLKLHFEEKNEDNN